MPLLPAIASISKQKVQKLPHLPLSASRSAESGQSSHLKCWVISSAAIEYYGPFFSEDLPQFSREKMLCVTRQPDQQNDQRHIAQTRPQSSAYCADGINKMDRSYFGLV